MAKEFWRPPWPAGVRLPSSPSSPRLHGSRNVLGQSYLQMILPDGQWVLRRGHKLRVGENMPSTDYDPMPDLLTVVREVASKPFPPKTMDPSPPKQTSPKKPSQKPRSKKKEMKRPAAALKRPAGVLKVGAHK